MAQASRPLAGITLLSNRDPPRDSVRVKWAACGSGVCASLSSTSWNPSGPSPSHEYSCQLYAVPRQRVMLLQAAAQPLRLKPLDPRGLRGTWLHWQAGGPPAPAGRGWQLPAGVAVLMPVFPARLASVKLEKSFQ